MSALTDWYPISYFRDWFVRRELAIKDQEIGRLERKHFAEYLKNIDLETKLRKSQEEVSHLRMVIANLKEKS